MARFADKLFGRSEEKQENVFRLKKLKVVVIPLTVLRQLGVNQEFSFGHTEFEMSISPRDDVRQAVGCINLEPRGNVKSWR